MRYRLYALMLLLQAPPLRGLGPFLDHSAVSSGLIEIGNAVFNKSVEAFEQRQSRLSSLRRDSREIAGCLGKHRTIYNTAGTRP
jgi:hypothetical protein